MPRDGELTAGGRVQDVAMPGRHGKPTLGIQTDG